MAGKIKVHAGLDYDLKGRTSVWGATWAAVTIHNKS